MKKRNSTQGAAFTMVEVVIALGIFAFVIVGLMGLFPVAMESARVSREETLVVNIARMVMAEVKASPFKTVRLVTERNPDGTDKTTRTTDLSVASPPVSFGYKLVGGPNGTERWNPSGAIADPASAVQDDAPPEFVVTFESSISGTVSGTNSPALAKVTVTVEAPAASPRATRRRYPFTVLVSESH